MYNSAIDIGWPCQEANKIVHGAQARLIQITQSLLGSFDLLSIVLRLDIAFMLSTQKYVSIET